MPVKKKSPTKLSSNKKNMLLKRQASYYEGKALQYSHELQQLQTLVDQFEMREEAQQKQLDSLKQALARQQAHEAEWSDKLEHFTEQIRDLEKRLAQQAKLLTQRENTISHYKEKEEKWKNSSFKKKAMQFEQQLQEQLKLNALYANEMDSLRQSLGQVNSQLNAAREQQLEEQQELIKRHLHEGEVWRQSLEEVIHQLSEAREQEAKLTDQVRQLTTDIESHQTKEQEWLQTVEDLRQAHLELQQELQQVIAAHEQEADQQTYTNAENIRLLEQMPSSHTEAQTGWNEQFEEKE